MKLLGSTKSKITKNESSDNVPNLEINEVVLVHCNIVNKNYQQNSGVLCTFVPKKIFWSVIRYFTQKFYIFKSFWLRIFIY